MSKELKIFLDDIRESPEGWILVQTVKDTIEYLKTNNVVELSLDHDLGNDEEGTGYDVLLWIENEIVENGFIAPIIKVHSANVSARTKMELAIQKIQGLF